MVCPAPKMSRYPVALLPGQYSDYVRPLTPAQLNELPLNTILSTPEVEQVRDNCTGVCIILATDSVLTSIIWKLILVQCECNLSQIWKFFQC